MSTASIDIDDELFNKALETADPNIDRTEIIREVFKSFIQVQAAKRLIALGGSARDMKARAPASRGTIGERSEHLHSAGPGCRCRSLSWKQRQQTCGTCRSAHAGQTLPRCASCALCQTHLYKCPGNEQHRGEHARRDQPSVPNDLSHLVSCASKGHVRQGQSAGNHREGEPAHDIGGRGQADRSGIKTPPIDRDNAQNHGQRERQQNGKRVQDKGRPI